MNMGGLCPCRRRRLFPDPCQQERPGNISRCTSQTPGYPWNDESAKPPRIIAKLSFAAKSSQNPQTYFILRNPVQEAASGSHADHTDEEEEVKKRGWEREPFCPKLHLGEVASTVEFNIVAQSFRISKSLCGLCLSYLIFNESLGFGTNYLLGRRITLIS